MKKLFRAYRSRGYNGSWMCYLHIGPGAGYRWIDLPGHSRNVKHKIRSKLYIAGRTLAFGRKVRRYKPTHRIQFWFFTFTRNANFDAFPQW